jgi:hypothetical protein
MRQQNLMKISYQRSSLSLNHHHLNHHHQYTHTHQPRHWSSWLRWHAPVGNAPARPRTSLTHAARFPRPISIRQNISIRQPARSAATSAYVSIRQAYVKHTSSMRQHTAAHIHIHICLEYRSICQHTAAYVSIRQHMYTHMP